MGIKSLHKLLQKYAEGCYQTKHLSEYAFKKVAIDISLYLYKYKAISGDKWLESFIALINSLRKNDVHCIFIIDGQAPPEKLEEQKKRRDSRDKQREKIKLLEEGIEAYETEGTVSPLIDELCSKQMLSIFRPSAKTIDISLAKEKLESMKSMLISITSDDIVIAKKLFDILNVPYVQAPGEAECYGAHLCVDGKVDAVLSEDTDVLAYGAPIFLTKIDYIRDTVVEISYEKILEETEMTKETFTDLCIMCECDYNSNIYLIGPEKSYQFLKNFKRIEEVLEELKKLVDKNQTPKYTDEMFVPLKYERCRELFTNHPIDFYMPYCGTPDFSALEEFLFTNHIRYDMAKLKKNLSVRCDELVFQEEDGSVIDI